MTDNNSTTSTENPSEFSEKVSVTDDSKTQTVQDKSDGTKSTELKTENTNEDELAHGNRSVSNLDSNKSSEVTGAQVLSTEIKSDPTDLTQQNQLNSEVKPTKEEEKQITNDNIVSENNVDSPLVHQETKEGSDPSSEEPKLMEINEQPSLSEPTTENIPNSPVSQGLSTINNNNNNGSQPMDLEGTGDVVSTPDPTSEGDEQSEQELDEDTSDPTTREEVAKKFQQTIENDRLQSYETLTYKIDQSESWLDLQFHNQKSENGVVKPEEIKIPSVSTSNMNEELLNRIKGSMIGMALGDALGAHVEFRPHAYLEANPVKGLGSGGTWGLKKGQFTDDTSMALCLANSLIVCQGFVPYDQLVRYKWWYEYGYMSSTGSCFDIGNATRESVVEFTRRQQNALKNSQTNNKNIDYPPNDEILKDFNVYCSSDGVAGNGALMRLAPVPLFFFRSPKTAVEYSGISGQITHGDQKSYDACRYYGALIVAALNGYNKVQLLDDDFYSKHTSLFNDKKLHEDIEQIARGSYKRKNGYEGGIRGTGYIVNALEAALWAFYSTKTFKDGALAAVNLGDDTDTTAAIYGQLAGAYYGYKKLPQKWTEHVYAREFLEKLSECIAYGGDQWYQKNQRTTAE